MPTQEYPEGDNARESLDSSVSTPPTDDLTDHHCHICETDFDTVAELVDHDCTHECQICKVEKPDVEEREIDGRPPGFPVDICAACEWLWSYETDDDTCFVCREREGRFYLELEAPLGDLAPDTVNVNGTICGECATDAAKHVVVTMAAEQRDDTLATVDGGETA